jgi:hypothetical protein
MAVTYPGLPENVSDLQSIQAWIKAATQILNTLTGNVGSTGYASTVTLTSQGNPTQQQPVGLKNGDLWIALPVQATQIAQLAVWNNGAWVILNGHI